MALDGERILIGSSGDDTSGEDVGQAHLFQFFIDAADLNSDGSVDTADAGIMIGNWGLSGIGDLNNDDVVDAGLMFAEWTGDGVAPVPGPSCGLIMLIVILGVVVQRRGHRT